MANQQSNSDPDLAWLAGFLDGEGSFMVNILAGNRLHQLGRQYISPRITLVNTDMPTLEVVRGILVANGLPHHIRVKPGRVSERGHQCKDAWEIRAAGLRRCKQWLDVLIPYLHTKRPQAEAMLQLVESRLAGYQQGGYTEEEVALAEDLRSGPRSFHRLHARPA
jgi:hypothetical protein